MIDAFWKINLKIVQGQAHWFNFWAPPRAQAFPRQLSQLHAPNPPAGLSTATLAATRPSHLFLRAFKPAVCPPSNLQTLLSTATLAATRSKPSRKPFHGNPRSHTPQPSVFKGVQACRLPALQPSKPSRRPFHGISRSHTPQPSVFKGVQACRLPVKPSKLSKPSMTLPQAFPRKLSQLHAPNPPACLSTAALAATRPTHLFLRSFKPAVCPLSNPPNPPAGLSTATLAATRSKPTLAATRPSHLFLRAFKPAVCPPSKPSKPSKPSRRPFHGNSRSYTLQTLPQAFPRQLSQPHAPAICF